MEWKKVSTEIAEFIDHELTPFNCDKKKMFGCPVYFVNNNMFAGVQQDNLFIRLSEKDREEIFALNDEVKSFEPMEGRIMKDYVVLPESVFTQKEFLDQWLNRSYSFVSSLAPKEPKSKKKKANVITK